MRGAQSAQPWSVTTAPLAQPPANELLQKLLDNIAVIRYDIAEVIQMQINDLLAERGITRYRLAKESGVPHSTLKDICLGKAKIENCSGETLFRLARVLGVSIETLLADAMEHRPAFETFKSNVCHSVKDMGDIEFLIDVTKSDSVFACLEKRWYREGLYLLAMVDYLCRENGLPLDERYAELRRAKLSEILYPAGVLILCAALNSDEPKARSLREAIPEFLRHNIVEAEVRNVA
jgi:transcriptional regulator with XRE-family HTH domain